MKSHYYTKDAAKYDAEYFGLMCLGCLITLTGPLARVNERAFTQNAYEAVSFAVDAAHAALAFLSDASEKD